MSWLGRVRNGRLLLIERSSKSEESFVVAVSRAVERSANVQEDEAQAGQGRVSLNLAQQFWEYELKGVGLPWRRQHTALQIDASVVRTPGAQVAARRKESG